MSGGKCSADVSQLVQGQLLQVYPGLLALSAACGVFCGLLTAALLLRFCLRAIILRRQGCNICRLLEPEEADLEKRRRSSDEEPGAINEDHEPLRKTVNTKPQKKAPPVSGDVAAFATKAKVIYPINQKHRPLADGASNPSLHEACKDLPASSSSSSCSDEDSDEEGDDCEGKNGGGHFVSSGETPLSLQNHSFTPLSNRALTLSLSLTGVECRMNLYFLALRDVQQNHVQLQEEKDLVYSLMLKTLFGDRFPKNKQESDLCKTILQTQEKELRELKKPFPFSSPAPEEREGVVTLEEIEQSQKELLEHGLHTCDRFSKQVEDLSQLLLRNTSVFHPEEAQEITCSISKSLLLLENHLQSCQESLLTSLHEKVRWWEELTALLQTQPVLLRQETCLVQTLVSRALEQMTSDGELTFGQMEKIMSAIQDAQSNSLKQHFQECVRKTSDLATERMNRLESKRRKMLKNQSKERRVLEQPQRDLQEALKVHQELALRHRQQLKDLESQQELRLTDAIAELWTSLRSSWSSRLADQCRSLLLSLLSSESGLTQEQAEGMWSDLEQALGSQLHEAESSMRGQLQESRERLQREGQTWREEMVLVEVCLKHLRDHQIDCLQALELRQSYSLHNQEGRLLALKHLHLWGALRRLFVLRHVSLNLLKEMRLSTLCESSQDPAAESRDVDAMRRRWPEERCLLELRLKQEFLSELETGGELLQRHLQTIMGNALSHSVQREMERETPDLSSDSQQNNMKSRLMSAASESVYLTKDSLCALVQKYYTQIQRITGQLQQERRLSDDEEEHEQSSTDIMKTLLRELQNGSKKPRSAEFHQRVEQHKRRLLVRTDREQQQLWEELRHRRVARDITLDKVKDQLMEAEERFMEELAALARVTLQEEETDSMDKQEDNFCGPKVNIMELLALNPALDPALNPSLTPLVSAPVRIVLRDRKKTT